MGLEYVHTRLLNASLADERIKKQREARVRLQAKREEEARAALNAVIHERERIAAEREQERQAQRRAQVEGELRRRFLASGGTEAEWQRAKAAIIDAYLVSSTLAGSNQFRDDVGELGAQSAYNRI